MADVLWAAEELSLTIGRQTIYDNTSVAVFAGERCALVGRNGCGKSTLLRIITGEELPGGDSRITRARGLRVAVLPSVASWMRATTMVRVISTMSLARLTNRGGES